MRDYPLKVIHNSSKQEILGLLACLTVCLLFVVSFGFIFLNHDNDPVQDIEVLVFGLVGFSCAAIFFLAWVIKKTSEAKKERRVYSVEGDFVQCFDSTGMLWQEPIQNYQQLRWDQQTRSHVNQYGRQFYNVQVITLDHSCPEYSFEIACHQNPSTIYEPASQWVDALALPIVSMEAGQMVKRTAAELLEKSLLELSKEGRLVVDSSNYSTPPHRRISYHFVEQSTLIDIKSPLVFATIVAVLIVLLGFIEVFEAGRFLDDLMPLKVCSGFAFGLVLLALASRQVIQIDRNRLNWKVTCLGFPLWSRAIKLDQILRVYATDTLPVLTIVQAKWKRIFVFGLNVEAADWLARFLQNSILIMADTQD